MRRPVLLTALCAAVWMTAAGAVESFIGKPAPAFSLQDLNGHPVGIIHAVVTEGEDRLIQEVTALSAVPQAAEPAIRTEDVTLFYKVYDSAGGHPTADQLQHDYLDKGSEGLHKLAEIRNVTGARIADTRGPLRPCHRP